MYVLWWNLACSTYIPSEQDLALQTHIAPSFRNLQQNISLSANQENQEKPTKANESHQKNEQDNSALHQFILFFDDRVLQEILILALEKNPNVLTMISRINRAKSQAKINTAQMFPSVGANLNSSYVDRRTLSQSTIVRPGANSINATLNLSWELDLFGKLNALRESSKKDYAQAQNNLAYAQISLIAEVASLYFNLRENANAIHNAQNLLENLQQIQAINQRRYQLGLLDVKSYSAFVASTMEQKNILESLKFTYEQNKNALLVLLNITIDELDERVDFLDSTWKPLMIKEVDIPNIPSEVILSRADIQANIMALYSQLYRQTNAKMARLPSISLSGSIGEILYSTNGVGSLVFQIANSLSAPILNRTLLQQNYEIQQELSKEAFFALQNNINTALGEIENSLFDTQSKQRQIQNLNFAFEVTQQAYQNDGMKLKQGLLDRSEFLKSENSFLSTRKQLFSIQINHILSYITLFKALGGNFALKEE